jgi:hypothetical protein
MSSALLAALFATLGLGLLGTLAACLVLWRRVRAMTSSPAEADPSGGVDEPPAVSVVLPKGPARSRNDEWTRRFDDLLGKVRALEARLATIEGSATEPAVSASIASRRTTSKPGRRVDLGGSTTSAGPTLISVPDLTTPPGSNAEAATELDRRYGPVWAMADDGLAVDAIARETGYPIGQVELILGLRRRLLVAEAGPDV